MHRRSLWLKNNATLGLGISKSLGDRMGSNIGVILNPEIIE
jgi:hypothetical protein